MSGATVGAADGCWLNLADWLLPRAEKSTLFDAVLALNYASKSQALAELGSILQEATTESPRQGPWEDPLGCLWSSGPNPIIPRCPNGHRKRALRVVGRRYGRREAERHDRAVSADL